MRATEHISPEEDNQQNCRGIEKRMSPSGTQHGADDLEALGEGEMGEGERPESQRPS